MTRDHDEIILDAYLAEELGDLAPPNLAPRIMRAYNESPQPVSQEQTASPSANGNGSAARPPALPGDDRGVQGDPPIHSDHGAAPPVQLVRRAAPPPSGKKRRPQSAWRNSLALTACVLIAGIGVGAWMINLSRTGSPQPTTAGSGDNSGAKPDQIVTKSQSDPPAAPNLAHSTGQPQSIAPQNHDAAGDDRPSVASEFPLDQPAVAQSDSLAQPAAERPEPLTESEIVALVNNELRDKWVQYDVAPAPAATDAEWTRRTYLRLLGRIPTVAELQQFVRSKSPDKRERLVESLLYDSRYAEEYGGYWSAYWSNVLIGRLGGIREGDSASRAGLAEYLHASLASNKAYDRLAYELLTAEGAANPAADDFNGAVNFLLSGYNEKATLATSRASRVFLGRQVQCVQCHDHPTNQWKQHEFWQLNAFFRQMHVENSRDNPRLVDRDFSGEARGSSDGETYFERLNGKVEVAYPRFPDGSPAPSSGNVDDVNRRELLAHWIVASPDFSMAAVNRLWSHFFGFGFTRQVDDLGPHNPPSHPELLQNLAGQFAAHDYDLKKLLKWIALSEAFGLSSRMPADHLADAPNAGGRALFSYYYTRQMSPEEVFQSLQLAAAAAGETSIPGIRSFDSAQVEFMNRFTRDMQTDEGNEESTFDGSIRQSLSLMTGPEMQRAVSIEPGSLLHQVIHSKMNRNQQVEHLFLAAVARPPTARELRAVDELVRAHQGDVAKALQDIWWALLNSNEFILDH